MRHKLYTTDGSELVADYITRVKNNVGEGYRVDAEINGHKAVMFYKTAEIETIMPLSERGED